MDKDNKFNVDDILLEIKSRKAREKGRAPTPDEKPTSAGSADEAFRRALGEAEQELPGFPAARSGAKKEAPPLRFSLSELEDEPEIAPPRRRRDAAPPEPEAQEETILPDLSAFAPREPEPPRKRRRSVDFTPPTETAADDLEPQDLDFSTFAPPEPESPARSRRRRRGAESVPPLEEEATSYTDEPETILPDLSAFAPPEPVPELEPPQDTGLFDFFTPGEEGKKNHNPLDFDGHVQSITDKARIRQKRRSATPPPGIPVEPPTPGDHGETQVLDFSAAFGALGEEDTDAVGDDTQTRVLPKLGFSRELDLGELKDMDFSAAADEYDYDDEDYDDEPFNDEDFAAGRSIDFSEYNSTSDRREVAIDIARVKLWLVIRALVTAILTGSLFYLVLAGRYTSLSLPEFLFPERDMRMYMMGLTAMTVLVALVNSSAVGGGLISLFKLRANSDTLAALALLGSLAQCVFGTARSELVDPEQLTLYCCVAALSMLFNALGKMTMISRIQANFKIISSDRPKRAVLMADSPEFCREFVHEPTRRPTVAVSAKCDFFTDFLALSYSDRYDVGINRAVAPACLLGSIIVCVLTYMLTKGDSMTAVSAMTAILCVSATFSATFIENVPLGKLTKKLAPRGGMVSGNKAVEDFCDTHALVMTDNDLFPAGHINLLGIKTHSQGRVDEAILDAASVICASGGALTQVFLGMIGGNRKLLKKVDNLVYENGMGISAWVDQRRVLIGNRALMQSHGIVPPEPGFEQKYADQGGESIFLSNSGEVCAQFVVGYQIDEELALELDQLALRSKVLVVYTMDATLTPEKLWALYGYPEELIRIMPAELHAQYEQMTQPRASAVAEVAYTGRASALAGSILACVQARSSILTATVVQMVQIVVGYGLIALMAFMGVISTLSVVELCVYQMFWFLAISLVQKLRSA